MPEIFEGLSEQIERGVFHVNEYLGDFKEDEIVESTVRFIGDNTRAAFLFGWGIASLIIKEGKNALVSHNPLDKVLFPGQHDL
jgi:hypothetical protein